MALNKYKTRYIPYQNFKTSWTRVRTSSSTSWWQWQKAFSLWTVKLSCKPSLRVPLLLRLDTVCQFKLQRSWGLCIKKSTGRRKTISPVLSRRIQLALHQETGQSAAQMKLVTGANCRPITISIICERRVLGTKTFSKALSPSRHKIVLLEFEWENQTRDNEMWKNILFSDDNKFKLDGPAGFQCY